MIRVIYKNKTVRNRTNVYGFERLYFSILKVVIVVD
jgi:hypothetical protein